MLVDKKTTFFTEAKTAQLQKRKPGDRSGFERAEMQRALT
jgi:hypothetical protein